MAKKKTNVSQWMMVKRNIGVGLLLVVVLYFGIHMISRTDGARGLVADKISNGTRLPVALERCSTTPLMGLHLEGLDFYGVRMHDVRVKFNWFAWASKGIPLIKQLDIRGLEVDLRRIPESGKWEPLVLNDLGGKLGAVLGMAPTDGAADETLPKFPDYVISGKTLLQLRRAEVVWRDGQNRELAYITDLETGVKEVAFSDRKALQVLLNCGHIKLASGKMLRDFQLEAVQIDGYDPTLILKMSDSDGEYEGFQTKTLWHDLSLHLENLAGL